MRDAVAAEFARSGMQLPISDETMALREDELPEAAALMNICLGDAGITAKDLREFFQHNAKAVRWDEQPLRDASRYVKKAIFDEDEPTDHFKLSLPWIDRSRVRAIIYIERRCPLCGFGRYLVLHRGGSGWAITAECVAWVS